MKTRFLLIAVLLALLAGCGSSTQAARPTQTVLAKIAVPSHPAAAFLVSSLVGDYVHSDWSAVRGSFGDPHLGQLLVRRMLAWKSENVSHLQAKLVHLAPQSSRREVGTVEFYDDPRAIPDYEVYVFGLNGSATRILEAASGIKSSTFVTANWKITRSSDFVFFHSPYQLMGSDRAAIASLQYERRQFIKKFHVLVARRIDYYLYPQQSLMGPMTHGACGSSAGEVGCADPYSHPPEIHTVEWPSYHEPVHVYELALEPPVKPRSPDVYLAPLFISEGTAVALEDKSLDPRLSDYCSDLAYIPLDHCARAALLSSNPIDLLPDHGFKKAASPGDAYALGGSFVKFLILKYGYRLFGRFYYQIAAQYSDRVSDYNVATHRVYHASIQHLLSIWESTLSH